MFLFFAEFSVPSQIVQSYLCDPGGEVLLISPKGFCEV